MDRDNVIGSSEEQALGPSPEKAYDQRQAKWHLRGWLSYAFASEVFVVVSLTMFLPICLEQFARDNGMLLPDKTDPCLEIKEPVEGSLVEDARCVVKIGRTWIDTASFSLYVYSASVVLQALTVVSMGGIANDPLRRKHTLLFFAALGSVSATLFIAIRSSSPLWFLVALLAICANIGFGASVVAMNAYLPMLAREDKGVVEELETLRRSHGQEEITNESSLQGDREDSAAEPLLPDADGLYSETAAMYDKYASLLSRATARISSTGIALGYFSGIIALIIALIPVTKLRGSTFSLRLAVSLSGLWWALFTIPAWSWLPGSEYSRENIRNNERNEKWNLLREVWKAWNRLGRMLYWKEIQKLKNTYWFLCAWFLLSDGFTTITSTALLFGKTSLHMSPSALILVGILTNTSGILGSLLWPRLQRHFLWSNKKILIILVMMCSMIPAYGCLGFLPLFHEGGENLTSITKLRIGGLTTQGEMFGLAIYFGTVYGAFQGYARAMYSELIPPGEEARWFGLYSITDKSSSFLGPLVVGIIADSTGNIRYSFFFLVTMVWLAVPFLMLADPNMGREDALRYRYSGDDD